MTSSPFRWTLLVVVGLVAGLANVVVGAVLYLSGAYFEPWALVLMTALLPVYIAAGTWWFGKHALAGHTTYPKALVAGIAISVMMGLTYAAYNVVSITFLYAHFLEDAIQAELARVPAGMSPIETARVLATLREEITLKSLAVANLMAICRLGSVFSVLVSLAFLERWHGRDRRVAAGA